MPLSKKQIEANRENAQKSTGPNTPEGKEIAAKNSTKHGLHARDIIIDSPNLKENREEYENLVAALFNEFQPVGEFQENLVRKMANTIWRSRRLTRAETAHINSRLDEITAYPHISTDSETGHQLDLKSIPTDYFARLILHYEMRLDRQLMRAYQMLTHHQRMQNENLRLRDDTA